ncbi:MAG: methyltransferase domain-containing protein [Actinobacteria bacterium]|nr:methyltransferase domain-containing protein [Actinomycetota bacterium]
MYKENNLWNIEKYNKIAPKYDSKMRLFLPNKYRRLVASYFVKGSVLDVACGTGTVLKYAYQKGLDCYGIDLSGGMIGEAKLKVPEIELKIASYYNIPFNDNQFDYVVATYALGGTDIDINKALSEMIRVCKKNGQIIILDWQKKEKENLLDKIFIKIAKLSEDTPGDFSKVFSEKGYKSEIIRLSYAISIIKMMKC